MISGEYFGLDKKSLRGNEIMIVLTVPEYAGSKERVRG
jgi:hypothetical protein